MSVFLCIVEHLLLRYSFWILPFRLICLLFCLMTPLISPPPLCGTLLHPCPEVTWETTFPPALTEWEKFNELSISLQLTSKNELKQHWMALAFSLHKIYVTVAQLLCLCLFLMSFITKMFSYVVHSFSVPTCFASWLQVFYYESKLYAAAAADLRLLSISRL